MMRVPGDFPLFIEADSVKGTITLSTGPTGTIPFAVFTAIQSAHLRYLLQKAESVVETGLGEMK